MTQHTSVEQSVREEERVLGITYERVLPMIPKLLKHATGAEPRAYGDGYWVAAVPTTDGSRREVTVRLGKQGADTRFSVRAESVGMSWQWVALVTTIAILTMGLGILFFLPAIQRRVRTQQRERDLLVHRTFRAIEDAVAEQGASPGYRVAPGVGAAEPEADTETADAPSAEQVPRRA